MPTDPSKTLHYSEGKSGVDQIPPDVLLALGAVYSMGEEKYGRDNWKKGTDWSQFIGSALRHIYKWSAGEDIDVESGLSHLSHALWNIVALSYYQAHNVGIDNRDVRC